MYIQKAVWIKECGKISRDESDSGKAFGISADNLDEISDFGIFVDLLYPFMIYYPYQH